MLLRMTATVSLHASSQHCDGTIRNARKTPTCWLCRQLLVMKQLLWQPGECRRGTLPKPMIARVLPTMETPTYLVRSHFPAFTEASAWATLRLSAQMSAMPCSAAATVLAVGAFTTRQPCCADCQKPLRQLQRAVIEVQTGPRPCAGNEDLSNDGGLCKEERPACMQRCNS